MVSASWSATVKRGSSYDLSYERFRSPHLSYFAYRADEEALEDDEDELEADPDETDLDENEADETAERRDEDVDAVASQLSHVAVAGEEV